jgi:hypothetical protein
LRNQPVTFQAGEVAPGRRYLSGAISLRHRTFARTQKIENPAMGAFEQPLAPAYIFHQTKHHGRQDKVKITFD